jgi:hypothetical protein
MAAAATLALGTAAEAACPPAGHVRTQIWNIAFAASGTDTSAVPVATYGCARASGAGHGLQLAAVAEPPDAKGDFAADFTPPAPTPGRSDIPQPIGAAAFAIALGLLLFFRLHHPRR